MRTINLAASAVRAVIAAPGDREAADRILGSIELRAHQRQAVTRIREMIDRSGGALLADEAGLGKTYVALSIARSFGSPIIVAPAALGPMWDAAMEAARVRAAFVSYERMSRGSAPARPVRSPRTSGANTDHDLVVLDEAHHVRNPATRRYHAISDLCSGAAVVLLSATPIHNRRRDLEALLALFLGERTASMTDAELMLHVYRRERRSIALGPAPPRAEAPISLPLPHDEGLLEALVALPPPLPPADGGDGGALLVHSLVRQWASSDGALRSALDRRAARAGALIDALSAGRLPTRAELRSWSTGEGAVQLAFPELMASEAASDSALLLRAVQVHEEAVNELRRLLRMRPSLDAERAGRIRDAQVRHPGEKIVAFTAYAATAAALYRELRAAGGVAMLTASGGRVAGGALTRRETIERFAPAAQGVRAPGAAERIDLLLATDLLSEGMNLQDASVVIHLDLPWTPARLEQRVGRAARLGSVHSRVVVYAFAPPASAERLIAVDERLRQKLRLVRATIGGPTSILPPVMPGLTPSSAESPAESVRQALDRWRRGHSTELGDAAAVGAVQAPEHGFIAAIMTADGPVLMAGLRDVITTDPAVVAEAVGMAEGADCAFDPDDVAVASAHIAAWFASRRAAATAGAGASEPLRRRIIGRIADIARRTPVHRRPILATAAASARAVAAVPMGAGAERQLAQLATSELSDEEWLAAVVAFGDRQPRRNPPEQEPRIIGLLLLRGEMSETG